MLEQKIGYLIKILNLCKCVEHFVLNISVKSLIEI